VTPSFHGIAHRNMADAGLGEAYTSFLRPRHGGSSFRKLLVPLATDFCA